MKIYIYVKKMCIGIISLSPLFAAKAFLKAKKQKQKQIITKPTRWRRYIWSIENTNHILTGFNNRSFHYNGHYTLPAVSLLKV